VSVIKISIQTYGDQQLTKFIV